VGRNCTEVRLSSPTACRTFSCCRLGPRDHRRTC
jgi:hypothetical protein